ncbi:hypothetical protein ACFX2A_037278 [Malus domestica]
MGRQARVDTTEVQCISISNTTDLKSDTPWHLTRHPSYNSLLHTPNSPNASVSSAAGDTAPIVCNTLSDKWRETRWFMASATGEAKACIDGMISYLVKAVTNLDSGFSSDQSPGFKEPHTGGSLPPHPSQPFGQGEIGWCKTETVLTSE